MITIRRWALVTILATGGAGSAVAQSGGALGPAEFFDLLDINKDQAIEASEVPEAGRAAFEKLLKNGDTNHNGRLEQDEYRALVSTIDGAGRGDAARAAGGAPAGREFGERFAAVDRNGDGKISKDEWPGQPAGFTRADTDKDGFVSRDEARTFFAAQGAGNGGGLAVRDRLKAMDKNGDGKVTKQEFTGPEAQFSRIDTDRDGVLSTEEIARFRPGGLGPQRFKELDKNGDGKLSRDEFDGPPAAFDRIDADSDGVITPQEVRDATQAAAAKKAAAKKDAQ